MPTVEPDRVNSQCRTCVQTDDHPKVVVDGGVFHYDCLTAADRALVTAASPVAGALIDAADSGIHHDDLHDLVRASTDPADRAGGGLTFHRSTIDPRRHP